MSWRRWQPETAELLERPAVFPLETRAFRKDGGGSRARAALHLTPTMLPRDLTRRDLLKATMGGAAGLMLGAPRVFAAQADAAIGPESQRLADDLVLIQIPGETNVIAHTSTAGVLLVDGGSA